MPTLFNPDFSFKQEVGFNGIDPDACSKTLQSYHCLLWSNLLPNGACFQLDSIGTCGSYRLRDRITGLELSSDSMFPSFLTGDGGSNMFAPKRRLLYLNELDLTIRKKFYYLSWNIGGSIIFPSKRNGSMTINGARGFNAKIADRFDLTLECIRRYYEGEESPLTTVIENYAAFFDLFLDFKGYCQFFLLDDLAAENFTKVNFLSDFLGFDTSPLPQDMKSYMAYKKKTETIIHARAIRMQHSINKKP